MVTIIKLTLKYVYGFHKLHDICLPMTMKCYARNICVNAEWQVKYHMKMTPINPFDTGATLKIVKWQLSDDLRNIEY